MQHGKRLIYVHDPMCSWCWGFRPAFDELSLRLADHIPIVRLLGGLAPDSDRPMPAEQQAFLQDTWRHIQQRIPGTRFNVGFWQDCRPRRSTWPACRAVIAARAIAAPAEPRMIDAIQRAYYLDARNPSDDETLVALAAELGLDTDRFATLLSAASTHQTLATEIAEAQGMGATSFPSLRLQIDSSYLPITVDYNDATTMFDRIRDALDSRAPRSPV